MNHSYLDKYSNLESPIHALDSRIKLITALIFITVTVLTPAKKYQQFLFYLILLLAFILLSRIPLLHVLKKSLVIIPFALLVAVFTPFFSQKTRIINPAYLFIWNVFIKSWTAVVALTLLTASTPFPKLLSGLERLKVPKIFILILSFMYRYIFVIIEEIEEMERGWQSRDVGSSLILKVRIFANIIGVLFIRTYERAERIYQSMVSRGFNGTLLTLNGEKIRPREILIMLLFTGVLIIIRRTL